MNIDIESSEIHVSVGVFFSRYASKKIDKIQIDYQENMYFFKTSFKTCHSILNVSNCDEAIFYKLSDKPI